MSALLAVAGTRAPHGPHVDWAALSPLLALLGGSLIVLLAGLLRSRGARHQLVPALSAASFAAAVGLAISQWDDDRIVVAGALHVDRLTLLATLLICAGGLAATLLAWRGLAARELAHGEFFSLMLMSAAGMIVLAAAVNLVTTFTGLELLSLPLYVLCAARMRSERSLESGLKYLIVGSVGSATLLYGFALIYGATSATGYGAIARAIDDGALYSDPLLLTGVGMALVGFGFKASLAPFHQWTPDVYEGAPTSITAFMSVATKTAAFVAIVRLFETALLGLRDDWRPVWIAVALASILVGNVGALGQSSMKRMLAFSSIAQAGYILVGVVVTTALGVEAVVFYLAVYLLANLAAFSVVIVRERELGGGDGIDALRGLGTQSPMLAAAMTLSMLSLAGIPATAGFIGKFRLIEAAADGGSSWLGIAIVVGSMISLAYYVPVVAAIWRDAPQAAGAGAAAEADPRIGRPALAGADPAADEPTPAGWHVQLTALAFGLATLVFGIVPQPLLNLVAGAARGLGL